MSDLGDRLASRLIELGRLHGQATDLMIRQFIMERFLARLELSAHAGRFALKGAMLIAVWTGDRLRATTDIDLHAMEPLDPAQMLRIVQEMCELSAVPDDSLVFSPEAAGFRPLDGGRPGGGRITVPVMLGRSRQQLKVDFSFGHPVTPGLEQLWYPSLLAGYDPVRIACYPKETAIAEKLATAVEFGRTNYRLRDYWDLHRLATGYGFAGHTLVAAIQATFSEHGAGRIVSRADDSWTGGLRPDFATATRRKAWRIWLANHVPSSSAGFDEVLATVTGFAFPLLNAVREGGRLPGHWTPATGWSRRSRARDLRPPTVQKQVPVHR